MRTTGSRGFRIELHAHTSQTSPCAHVPAETLVRGYAKAGYGAVVITDHFNNYVLEAFGGRTRRAVERYLDGYERAAEAGARLGVTVLLGAECCIAGGPEDFLLYGIGKDFLFEYPALYTMTQADVFRACRDYGALLFQAHPCRSYCKPRDPAYLDGAEVFNGNPRHENNNGKAAAFAERHGLLPSSGSDYHEREDLARGGLLLTEEVTTNADLIAALRQGKYTLITAS